MKIHRIEKPVLGLAQIGTEAKSVCRHIEERAADNAALPHELQQVSRFRGLGGDAVELRFDRAAESLP